MEFESHGRLTLGVEVEVQLIDWRTKDLCPAGPRLLASLGGASEQIKPEIFQSMLELCTGICESVEDVERDLLDAQSKLLHACDALGVDVMGIGTHPFARTEARLLYPSERYRMLIERNQWIARRLAIFGVHVHVGMVDGDRAMQVTNGILPYLSYLLALSSSSPFMHAQDTGLASARTTVFESQPTAGTPPTFDTWADFVEFSRRLRRGRAITSVKDLWWDIRPNPIYGTIEIRICDGTARLLDAAALAGLIQCLCADLDARADAGEVFPAPPIWFLRENKWRATRWGLEADVLVDFEGDVRPIRGEIEQLLARLQPHAERLACTGSLARIGEIMRDGTSSERQRRVLARTHSFGSVVDLLAREWRTGAEAH